jgi:hypothetical protein
MGGIGARYSTPIIAMGHYGLANPPRWGGPPGPAPPRRGRGGGRGERGQTILFLMIVVLSLGFVSRLWVGIVWELYMYFRGIGYLGAGGFVSRLCLFPWVWFRVLDV